MHKIIEDDPDWKKLQSERKQIAVAADIHNKQSQAEQAEYRRLTAQHTADREAALLAGEKPPPAPAVPTLDPADQNIFLARFQQCDARERQWMAAKAPTLERRLADQEADLLGQAALIVQHLRAIAGQVQVVCDTARKVRAAADDATPVHGKAIAAADLVAAVESGGSFLGREGGYEIEAALLVPETGPRPEAPISILDLRLVGRR